MDKNDFLKKLFKIHNETLNDWRFARMEFFIEKTLKGDGSNSYVLVNQDMEIIEEVALFLQDLERRNLAPNTVKLYCRNLKKFYEWVNKKKLNIFETSIKELIYFTDYLREQNLSPESINNINATVKSFYQFFYQIGGYYVPLFDKNQTIYKVERQRPKSFVQHSDLLTLKTRSKQKYKRLYPRDR